MIHIYSQCTFFYLNFFIEMQNRVELSYNIYFISFTVKQDFVSVVLLYLNTMIIKNKTYLCVKIRYKQFQYLYF